MRTETNSPASDKLSVVYAVRVVEGGEQGFREAYDRIRKSVASVPGHIIDRLGEPIDDSRQWVITSEWETPEHFFAWLRGEDHRALLGPLRAWVEQTQSLRYRVVQETMRVTS
ncbi:antibiotic biosynthesis monooxygenase family protein [Streptomyces sp. NPDC051018]|uniref:antibiotic biosynthesis monooxygenase family protein n=1 Tax=Streptomyces sp. NPDC051018 TaxID=3365639 RepID=UPI00378C0AF3